MRKESTGHGKESNERRRGIKLMMSGAINYGAIGALGVILRRIDIRAFRRRKSMKKVIVPDCIPKAYYSVKRRLALPLTE